VEELLGGIIIAITFMVPVMLFSFASNQAPVTTCGAPEEHYFPRSGVTYIRYACADGSYEWHLK
jgi:hypothetical protein